MSDIVEAVLPDRVSTGQGGGDRGYQIWWKGKGGVGFLVMDPGCGLLVVAE